MQADLLLLLDNKCNIKESKIYNQTKLIMFPFSGFLASSNLTRHGWSIWSIMGHPVYGL